jgi:hypothetical protein
VISTARCLMLSILQVFEGHKGHFSRRGQGQSMAMLSEGHRDF